MDLKILLKIRDDLNLQLENYFDTRTEGTLIDCLDQYWVDNGEVIWVAESQEVFDQLNFWVVPLIHREFTIKDNFIAIDSCYTTAKKPLTIGNNMELIAYKEVKETFVFDLTKKLELETTEFRKMTTIEFI